VIAVVDIGIGNLGSIINMFRKIGVEASISSRVSEIEKAEKLILPGVGSFSVGMSNLNSSGLVEVLRRKVVDEKVPMLGICLGMQMLGKSSTEGEELQGLGWIDAHSVRFRFDSMEHHHRLRVPHMGWNTVRIVRDNSLFKNMGDEPRFYFVHSYHLVCADPADVLTLTNYGYDFASSIRHGNIYGTQFHPEKSHRFGMTLLRNFAEIG